MYKQAYLNKLLIQRKAFKTCDLQPNHLYMIDFIVYLHANEEAKCDPNLFVYTVHSCHYKQNRIYHCQQQSKNCEIKKARQLIIKYVNWFRCSFHTKPIKTKTKHYDIVDLEPTFLDSVEETMIVLSVVNINQFKPAQHQQDKLRLSNRHDSKFHRSS